MYEIYCKLRDDLGLKDVDIVKATGITKSTFSDWKTGKSAPQIDKLQKIADFFGVTVDYLTTGKNESEIEESITMYNTFVKLLNQSKKRASDVSKATGIPSSTFSEWKKGKSTPKSDKLKKIADFFEVTVDYLIAGVDETKKKDSLLASKEMKEITLILANTKEQLISLEGLTLEGEMASHEAIESILDAMIIGLELAKKKNKKHTTNKYKRD